MLFICYKPNSNTNTTVDKTEKHCICTLIISLHEDGYVYDFHLDEIGRIGCVQECTMHLFSEININKARLFDVDCRTAKRIVLAIETANGLKGVLYTRLSKEYLKLWLTEWLRLKKSLRMEVF